MLNKKNLSGFFILIFFISSSFAQQTEVFNNPKTTYELGVELYKQKKFGAAEHKFDIVINQVSDKRDQIRINAIFYNAVCAYELFNKDAEYKLQNFIEEYPNHSKNNLAKYYLAKNAYRQKKYSLAHRYFNDVDESKLSIEDTYEFNFKSGYSSLRSKKLDEAQKLFAKVLNKNTKYASPSKYFHSHIAYQKEDYVTARSGFEDLMSDPSFMGIAPYYLIQINFIEDRLDEVISEGENLYNNATEKRKPEIARVVGESFYRKDQFEKAIPYFRDYFKFAGSRANEEEHYEMGFSLYKTGEYDAAIVHFQKATNGSDSISQYAYYHLAACYLNTSQKQFAQEAYQKAYEKDFDKEVKETSLFNYAQLAYELSYDPYSKAIIALQNYLKEYPNSSRNDEAYNFLFKIALSTKKYDDALSAIESIKRKDVDYTVNYQRILYYRGIELFNQYHFDDAIKMLKKAEQNNAVSKITALSQFWMAEAFYRTENYWAAIKYLNAFLNSKVSAQLPEYAQAYYNLGYANFKKESYTESIIAFKQFTTLSENPDTKTLSDALLRIGDAYFIQKKYKQAKQFYNSAISNGSYDSDYALYQKAIISGLNNDHQTKIEYLTSIVKSYKKSTYLTAAIFELGNSYLLLNDNENALIQFNKVISDYPKSSYALQSRLKTGLIYFNLGKNELALSTFQKVVDDYPATPESKEALVSIKNIYLETNKVDEFVEYVNGLSFADVSVAEQDSLTFIVAENLYFNEEYEPAAKALGQYIKKYDKGQYTLLASYYKSECHIRLNQKEEALASLEYIISKPKSKYTENALIKLSAIQMELEKYQEAYTSFYELENVAESVANIIKARYGKMTCNYKLNKSEALIIEADNLLMIDKIDHKMRITALMYKAGAYVTLDELTHAYEIYGEVVKLSQGESGAEAKYNQARIKYIEGDPINAENMVFELINEYAAFDYWIANSFILLADIYSQQNNLFQAKETLQSVIENYEGEDLKNLAEEKLAALNNLEEKQNEAKTEIEMEEIDID